MSAKLFFQPDEPISRDTCVRIQLDSVQKNDDWVYQKVAITQEQFDQLKSLTKDFTIDEQNNITLIDTVPCPSVEEYTGTLNPLKDLTQIRIEDWEGMEENTQFKSFLNELNAIDVSSMTFPLDKPAIADIRAKCPNFTDDYIIEN